MGVSGVVVVALWGFCGAGSAAPWVGSRGGAGAAQARGDCATQEYGIVFVSFAFIQGLCGAIPLQFLGP